MNVSSYIRSPINKQVIGLIATLNSLNDLLGKSGVAINSKIQQGGSGDRHGKEREPRKLLGRIPVIDTQFTIPRPVSHATITFHGLCAFNSIAFYGRRAENFESAAKVMNLLDIDSLYFILIYQISRFHFYNDF